ncbi:MAG: hypothetical protein IJ880_03950 [Bacilli bacterium]|nr:hypothetical protein [Bacilli bacterium]MBR3119838.1 hypothetical protein [Oceanobacillus sp.]
MPKLVVGLSGNTNSYYDAKTNTYITKLNSVREITYGPNTNLSGICHAVNSHIPALILYEGKFPKKTLDAWKAKYGLVGKQALNRADVNQDKSKDTDPEEPEVIEPPVDDPEEPEEPENMEPEEPIEPEIPEDPDAEDPEAGA